MAMTTVAPPIETHAPLVERFVEAISLDWRLCEAMAQRASSIISFRTEAGSKTRDV